MSAPAVLRHDLCREGVGATSHLHRPTIDAALNGVLRPEQPSKPQSGRKRFRETANTQYLLAMRQRIEAGRRCALNREVAVDIILHNQEVVLESQPAHFDTSQLRSSTDGGVMRVGNSIEHAASL